MSKQAKIVELIRELHLSSSDVSDALGRTRDVFGVGTPTQMSGPAQTIVGPIFHVAAVEGSNWFIHKLLQGLPEGRVVYVTHFAYNEESYKRLALVGGLICDYAINYRRALAVVVDGDIRDVEELRSKNLPVWGRGSTPVVCSKEPTREVELELNEAIAVCDATGCMVIKTTEMTYNLENKLKAMAKREENWFKQLKEGKNTFEITCEA